MADPNLTATTGLFAGMPMYAVGATEAEVLAAVDVGYVHNIEALFASNVHASVAGWITIIIKRGGTSYKFVNQLRVPVKSNVNILLGRPIYLEAGDSLRAQANQANNVVLFIPRTKMTDT